MITIERARDFDAIDAKQWNHLVAQSATRSVFQRYEWHRTWWDTFGSDKLQLILLIARDDGIPVGIASVYVDEQQVVRFVGHGRSDYSDLICPEQRNEVRSALLQGVLDQCEGWNRIALRHLPSQSPTVDTMESAGMLVLRSGSTPCPTLLIQGNRDFFEQVRRKKSLRRHQNYFRKQDGYLVEHLRRAEEIIPLLEVFFSQHIERWKHSGHESLFRHQINREFYQSLVVAFDRSDLLRFTRVSVGGAAIAFHFGFVFSNTFYWYKPTFDPGLAKKSPGEVLLKELLDLADAEQLDEFDFTVGGEEFKQRFANHSRQNIELNCFASRAAFQWHSAVQKAERCLKSNRLGRKAWQFTKRMVRR